jgi:hypothetical protein
MWKILRVVKMVKIIINRMNKKKKSGMNLRFREKNCLMNMDQHVVL